MLEGSAQGSSACQGTSGRRGALGAYLSILSVFRCPPSPKESSPRSLGRGEACQQEVPKSLWVVYWVLVLRAGGGRDDGVH